MVYQIIIESRPGFVNFYCDFRGRVLYNGKRISEEEAYAGLETFLYDK